MKYDSIQILGKSPSGLPTKLSIQLGPPKDVPRSLEGITGVTLEDGSRSPRNI